MRHIAAIQEEIFYDKSIIHLPRQELDTAVQSVNGNLQEITYASETVSEETQDVMESTSTLQTTTQQFYV